LTLDVTFCPWNAVAFERREEIHANQSVRFGEELARFLRKIGVCRAFRPGHVFQP
jgi:hypothetical protein